MDVKNSSTRFLLAVTLVGLFTEIAVGRVQSPWPVDSQHSSIDDPAAIAAQESQVWIEALRTVGGSFYSQNDSNRASFSIEAIPSPGVTLEYEGSTLWSGMHDVDVQGQYAYCAMRYYGLLVLDLSEPSAPSPIGQVYLPSLGFGAAIPYDITVKDDYAYVAARTGGLGVFDISDPYVPRLVERMTIAGELFENKAIVWFVVVESIDHIIAVAPDRRLDRITFIAVCLSITNNIQPMPGPPFSITGPFQ